jgi:hypothetical protein
LLRGHFIRPLALLASPKDSGNRPIPGPLMVA